MLTASNGEQAIRLAATHAGSIGLLLTDVIMPGLGGVELTAQVQQLTPGIRVLYMSGYTDGDIDRRGVLAEGAKLLQKPFTGTGLTLAVRAALDEPIAEPVGPAENHATVRAEEYEASRWHGEMMGRRSYRMGNAKR